MRKRARNHKGLVYCEKVDKFYLRHYGEVGELTNWKLWAKEMRKYYDESKYNYEPQGKKEAKKYNHTRGLLQFIPSTFDDDEISNFFKQAWRNRR